MASATPDLRLPSQPRSITTLWPVPNYTAWWTEAHVCQQLAQDCYLTVPRLGIDPGTFRSPASLVTVTPPSTQKVAGAKSNSTNCSQVTYQINIPDTQSTIFGAGSQLATIWWEATEPDLVIVLRQHLSCGAWKLVPETVSCNRTLHSAALQPLMTTTGNQWLTQCIMQVLIAPNCQSVWQSKPTLFLQTGVQDIKKMCRLSVSGCPETKLQEYLAAFFTDQHQYSDNIKQQGTQLLLREQDISFILSHHHLTPQPRWPVLNELSRLAAYANSSSCSSSFKYLENVKNADNKALPSTEPTV